MGGGRAITTAAKMAGIGVARGGLRGAAPQAADQFRVMNASVSKQASASITSSVHTAAEEDVTVLYRPAWEFDDWEFAGVEEEVVKPGGGGGNQEPIARVVFSGPPTLEEAKEATEDLKETIERVYLSSPKSEGSVGSGPVSGMLRSFQSSESTVSKGVDSGAYPVPQVAFQAFSFLSESPAAQSVVASIASDPKVWGAVMENKDLMKFLESNNSDASYQGECDDEHSSTNKPEANKEKPMEFLDILQDVKLRVVQLMENVSSYFGGLFGFGSNSGTGTEDGKAKATLFNDPRTLFGLAVMVIFMVVLKRA